MSNARRECRDRGELVSGGKLGRAVAGIAGAIALFVWVSLLAAGIVVKGWPWLWADWWNIGFAVALPVALWFPEEIDVGWVLALVFVATVGTALQWAWMAEDGFLAYLVFTSGPALLWPFGVIVLIAIALRAADAIADGVRYRCRRAAIEAILAPALRGRILDAAEAIPFCELDLTPQEVIDLAIELRRAGLAEKREGEA